MCLLAPAPRGRGVQTVGMWLQVPLERVKEAEAAAAQAQLDDSDMDDD